MIGDTMTCVCIAIVVDGKLFNWKMYSLRSELSQRSAKNRISDGKLPSMIGDKYYPVTGKSTHVEAVIRHREWDAYVMWYEQWEHHSNLNRMNKPTSSKGEAMSFEVVACHEWEFTGPVLDGWM